MEYVLDQTYKKIRRIQSGIVPAWLILWLEQIDGMFLLSLKQFLGNDAKTS